MPYWINSTLAATPALLWMFIGVGLPWALVMLPRRDWRDPAIVGCLTLAFGPALLTAWMFIFGVIGGAQNTALITLSNVFVGSAAFAALGWLLTWRKSRQPSALSYQPSATPLQPLTTNHLPLTTPPQPLTTDHQPPATTSQSLTTNHLPLTTLLIALIALALVIRWLGVTYWPSTAYDARWVYAYQGELYALKGFIPQEVGYYPPFLALQHTWLHLAVGGVDDHAARAVLPWLHLGSILAAYTLGRLLFTRCVGIYVAAIWTLYPHLGEWSRYGDLEVPVAFLFTAAAAFFLKAMSDQPRNSTEYSVPSTQYSSSTISYSLIAGLLLGIGLWTKPTMGAFIWGVMLVVGVSIVWRLATSYQRPATSPKLITHHSLLEKRSAISHQLLVPILTGLVCLPLGAAWYVRNLALGHNAVDFPPSIWLDRAARSGAEFGWPLLALLLGLAYLSFRVSGGESVHRSGLRLMWGGAGLVLAGVLPTILQPGRMGLLEWTALLVGGGLIGWALWRWLALTAAETRRAVMLIGAAGLLALPYFVTWFYSYSYHYRLSFAIVPLMILPTAVILSRWTEKTLLQRGGGAEGQRRYGIRSVVMGVIITALAIPGIINPLYDPNAGWDWLWTEKLPDDHARHRSGNEALMAVVDGLQIYLDTHDPRTEPLRVVAPGVLQLPFFFPLEDIRTGPTPAYISDLDDVTYFIYSVPESGGDFSTFIPGANPVLDLLGRAVEGEDDQRTPLRRAWWADDGIFQFNVYELHLDRRFTPINPRDYAALTDDVTFGGVVRLLGYDLVGLELWRGRPLWMHLYWQVIERPQRDLFTYVHLRDLAGNLIRSWDGPVSWRDDGFQWDAPNYASSLTWEPGEYIIDRRIPRLQEPIPPLGAGYQIVIGLYDPLTNERLPLFINGEAAGDGWTMPQDFSIVPERQ
jgi:hypothetical protein